MNRNAFLVSTLLCAAIFASGQPPPGPYPQGVSPPVSEGNGVWRFDRLRGREPAFFEQFAAMFSLIKPREPLPFGRSVAFLVGVGPYQHLSRLTHTSSDVTSMRNFLLESGGFDTVLETRDDSVSSVLLNTYMLNHFSKSNPRYLTGRDRFLFYYSGHGGNQGNLGYLLLSKADPNGGDYVTDTLDMQAVRRWAYVSVARQVLMILDTCNSGLAIQPMDASPVGGLGDDPSGILLTAGTGDQQAYQVGNNLKGYGVFTHAILEALRSGMDAQTPFMDIFEVYSRARAAVHGFEIEKGKKMQPDIDHRLARLNYERANGNFVFLNRNPIARNSLPGERFTGLAVEKKGTVAALSSREQLRIAEDQFNLLKNSADVGALRAYVDDYSELSGARTLVALINSRLDALTSSDDPADRAFRDTLRSIIAEVPTEFAHYGASELGWVPAKEWTPAGNLPASLECTGISTPAPSIRCTMFRSADLAAAERRLAGVVEQVQRTLRGFGWTIHEALDRTLTDYDDRWSQRAVVFKNASAVTVEAQLWKSKKDGHHEVDVVVKGVAHISQELQRMISEAASGFANYGAGEAGIPSDNLSLLRILSSGRVRPESWTPAGNLPDSLECTGSSKPAPSVRCTMLQSPDLALAERRMTEIIVEVQAALPGLDWTKGESASGATEESNLDWLLQRDVVFKRASGVTVEAQLWKYKGDGHHNVSIVVKGVPSPNPDLQNTFAALPSSLSAHDTFRGIRLSGDSPGTMSSQWTLSGSTSSITSLDSPRGISPSSSLLTLFPSGTLPTSMTSPDSFRGIQLFGDLPVTTSSPWTLSGSAPSITSLDSLRGISPSSSLLTLFPSGTLPGTTILTLPDSFRGIQPSSDLSVTTPSSWTLSGPASTFTSLDSLRGISPSSSLPAKLFPSGTLPGTISTTWPDALRGMILRTDQAGVSSGADQFATVLQEMIGAAPTGFLSYGINYGFPAGSTWVPAANLPHSLECTGTSTPAPMVRCTMFRSPDLALTNRLTEIVAQVQAALPGSGWTKDESSNEALADYNVDWWRREVVFSSGARATVEVQLWKSKKDGHSDIDVVVTSTNR